MNSIVYLSISKVCATLSIDELDSLYLCVMWDQNPKDKLFDYEKVKHLFTEGNGLRVNTDVKEALGEIVLDRHR